MRIAAQSLLTWSLKQKPWGEKAARIMAAALDSVDPARVIQDNLDRSGQFLYLPEGEIDLGCFSRIFLISIGKAALPMAVSLADILGSRLASGFILDKTKALDIPERYRGRMLGFSGDHPLPGEESLRASSAILSRLPEFKESDLVFVLLSGGGSSLFIQPASGISLADLKTTNQILLGCGANIQEINTIRKHLSRVKGGQLAKFLHPARIVSLILSDVMGDPIDIIASGPTAPDPSTFRDALAVVAKYQLEELLPLPVIRRLQSGARGNLHETPDADHTCFERVSNTILAGNRDALLAGADQAVREGYLAEILPTPLSGEASTAGRELSEKLAALASIRQQDGKASCLIAGGETTVTLGDTSLPGQGGRNLEAALSALPALSGVGDCALITLATDGEDGVTDAAGAVVVPESYLRCKDLGLDPEDFLARHDSYNLFKALDDLLIPGPTGTNVNDIWFLFTT